MTVNVRWDCYYSAPVYRGFYCPYVLLPTLYLCMKCFDGKNALGHLKIRKCLSQDVISKKLPFTEHLGRKKHVVYQIRL